MFAMTPSHHSQQSVHNNLHQHVANPSASYPVKAQVSSGPTYRGSNVSTYATVQRGGYGSMTHHNQQFGAHNQSVAPYRNPDQTLTSAQGSVNAQSAYSQQNAESASNRFMPNAHNSSGWESGEYGTSVHGISNNHVPNRSQRTAITSSYTTQAPATSTLAESHRRGPTTYQAQASRPVQSTRHPTTNEIMSASDAQSQVPKRYSSPSHVLQVQQQQQKHHSYQPLPSPTHTFPPQSIANQQRLNARTNSASVEPPPTTVNPSQVYDARAEQQRKEQIEVERRRKRDEQAAKRKAEEDRLANDRRAKEEKRKTEEARAEVGKRRVREEAIARGKQADKNEVDAMRAEMARRDKGLKADRYDNNVHETNQGKTAAAALQQIASSSVGVNSRPDSNMQAESEEAQMRAMFARMREFNAKNPNMLARLWEEERRHAQSQSPQPNPAPAASSGHSQASPATAPLNLQPRSPAPELGVACSTPALPPTGKSMQNPTSMVQPMLARVSDIQQSSQTRPQLSAQLWPKQKRPAISEVAVKWLMSLPENKGKILYAADVLKVLDGNPSSPATIASARTWRGV
nr:hypothetical protein CFP56_23825 [Quercus suber]